MKNFLLLALGATLAFSSCSQSPEQMPSIDGKSVAFTSKINDSKTRVSGSSFEEGDKISVFAQDGYISYAKNAMYEYSNGKFVSDSSIEYEYSDQALTFQALYPYCEDATSGFEFEIAADQSVEGAYEASDLLVAVTEPTHSDCPELSFYHKMSAIEINVSNIEGDADVKVYAQNSVKCYFDNDIYTSVGDAVEITPSANELSYRAVVAPQHIEAGETLVTINVAGKEYSWALSESADLASGYKYVCNVDTNSRGECTFSGDITQWNEGGDIPVNQDDEQGDVEPTEDLAFEVVETAPYSIVIETTPSSNVGNYFPACISSHEFDISFGGDASQASYTLLTMLQMYGANGAVADNRFVFNGAASIDLSSIWVVEPGIEYAVMLIGLDEEGFPSGVTSVKFVSTPQ